MRMSSSASTLVRAGISVLCALCLAAPAWADGPAPSAQAAVWTARQAVFVYHGFTTHFSCDGLRDDVRAILLELGARHDLKVIESSCAGLPAVTIRANVLIPAAQGNSQPMVAAHWQDVDLVRHLSVADAAGECELLEEVKDKILPLFSVRNVDYDSTCFPHEVSLASRTVFKLQVLAPDVTSPAL